VYAYSGLLIKTKNKFAIREKAVSIVGLRRWVRTAQPSGFYLAALATGLSSTNTAEKIGKSPSRAASELTASERTTAIRHLS